MVWLYRVALVVLKVKFLLLEWRHNAMVTLVKLAGFAFCWCELIECLCLRIVQGLRPTVAALVQGLSTFNSILSMNNWGRSSLFHLDLIDWVHIHALFYLNRVSTLCSVHIVQVEPSDGCVLSLSGGDSFFLHSLLGARLLVSTSPPRSRVVLIDPWEVWMALSIGNFGHTLLI